jgi:hypothetical protein
MTSLDEIASFRPREIHEALDMMRVALDFFHRERDHRAVFLHAYYLITIDVHDALTGQGHYNNRVFMDSEWIRKLAGKFSSLYFQSLSTDDRPGERAWKTAHHRARAKDTSVMQDLLLGINAHINYDLAYGIYLNMVEFSDADNHLLLPRRKFDHDQVNNILVNCIPTIEEMLARDYGGETALLGKVMGSVDNALSELGLKYYRERVWWSAISYLAGGGEPERDLVRAKLDWESAQLAESLACEGASVSRLLVEVFRLFRRERSEHIVLEHEVTRPARRPEQTVSPYA